ncbi:metallophosphoesterase family protein [Suttonella ornithocola]|uniref:Predicted phosphoesterase or phosphohydrolase n=1 Tax=Suttonella ornithocola TaxID=279832 RepID=A0A380MVA9_9GAMM|nr:metallophosphoesterase family protein [Suttonella ornithocola]SUO95853.1 Predicted phosphoesterase or phosphohydrolase [Suttonella ornithocola]
MQIFFTSDTHFFHRNIIKYCHRPFISPDEMNQAMVTIWNRQVKKTDRVYHLGDVSFGGLSETFQLLAQLNGEICLISGNHDDELIHDPYLRERFRFIRPYHEEKIDGQELVMCHYPIMQWRNAQRGAWHLYGHTHGSLQVHGAAMDVGIDAHPLFRLWRWSEIKAKLGKKRALPYPSKPIYPEREFSEQWEVLKLNGEPIEKC